MEAGESGQQNWRPIPDPTVLTTEQLHREINALEARMLGEVGALKTLLEASIAHLTSLVDDKVTCHDELDDARFDRIDARFDTLERHRLEQKEDTAGRLNYAIDTLKERADEHFKTNQEAIGKSERAVDTLIDKLSDEVDTKTGALSGKIDDLKERVGTIEASSRGAEQQRTEGRAHISTTTAVIGTVIAVVGILLALLVGHNSATRDPVLTTPTVTVVQTTPG